jgi:hypothetical protein
MYHQMLLDTHKKRIYHTIIIMLLDTRNKNIYEEGISTVLITSCLKADRTPPYGHTYIPSDATGHKKTRKCVVYGWESQQLFFLYLYNSFLRGGGGTPYGHDLHTIWFSLIQGTRIYKFLGWRVQQFSRYKNVPYCTPTRHPGKMTLAI